MLKAKNSNKTPAVSGTQTDREQTAPLTAEDVRAIVAEVLRAQNTAPPREIIGFDELVARLPQGPRTLREEIKRGRIPHIRLPGARRLLFDWQSVQRSLLRFEQGGIQHAE